MDGADTRFHLDGTFLHTGGLHQFAGQRSEHRSLKLFPFIVILLGFDLRHGIFSSERREYFDLRPHFGRGQIHDAFRVTPDIIGSFGGFIEAEEKCPAEGPERGDRSEIGRAVFV